MVLEAISFAATLPQLPLPITVTLYMVLFGWSGRSRKKKRDAEEVQKGGEEYKRTQSKEHSNVNNIWRKQTGLYYHTRFITNLFQPLNSGFPINKCLNTILYTIKREVFLHPCLNYKITLLHTFLVYTFSQREIEE